MYRFFFLIIYIFLAIQVHALTPYEANYDLYVKTPLGTHNIGSAHFNLNVNDNNYYVYTTEASTESLWRALYDYSGSEKSIGLEVDGELISTFFSVRERVGGSIKKNYGITIIDRNYAISSKGKEWKINPGVLVDQLSVYLALSMDIQKNPDQVEFIYQVVDEDGVEYLKFFVGGHETLNINNNEMETIAVNCPELKLTLSLSVEHNLQPVLINKINGKTEFILKLKDFETPS
ncbi:DUF3108 domain-containing protein [Candidatus Thioglobus sp.]|nr:DUF3108 domain-containing protein [Candidatus Thioglobus sp.]